MRQHGEAMIIGFFDLDGVMKMKWFRERADADAMGQLGGREGLRHEPLYLIG